MTVIVETNKSTFKRIESGEISFIVHKFSRPVMIADTIIFQEIDEAGKHTEQESKYLITQIESDGCKSGFHAVAFKEKES